METLPVKPDVELTTMAAQSLQKQLIVLCIDILSFLKQNNGKYFARQ